MNTLKAKIQQKRLEYTFITKQPIKKINQLKDLQSNQPATLFEQCNFDAQKFFECSLPKKKQTKAKMFKKNPQNLLQIFTIQYLHLCSLEFHRNQSQFVNSIIQLIGQPEFQIIIPNINHPLSKCSQETLKNIVNQFLRFVNQHHKSHSVEQILSKYPLVFDIFIGIHRALLQLGQVCTRYDDPLQMQSTFQFLTSYYGVQTSYDPSSSCTYFHKTSTFVFFGEDGQAYMVQQQLQDQLSIGSIKQQSNQQNQDEVIDLPNISMLLGNSANKNQFDQQQVTRHISNIQIPLDSELENQKSQKNYQCKLAQSEIIKQDGNKKGDHGEQQIKGNNHINNQKDPKGSITTTFSSFRQTSLNNTLHQSFKAYINTPTTLISQFFQAPSSEDIRNNYSVFMDVLGTANNQQHPTKSENKENKYSTMPSSKEIQDGWKFSFTENNALHESPLQRHNPTEYNQTTSAFFTEHSPSKEPTHVPQITERKPPRKWVNKNITKQFTNSFVLMSIPQPYRSKIQAKKDKARQQRRNILQSSYYFPEAHHAL